MSSAPGFPLLTSLLLLFVSSRILGQLFKRWGMSTLVGEIFSGILLGPSIFGLVQPSPELDGVAELGIFFLTFLAGLEIDTNSLFKGLRGKGLRGRIPLAIVLSFLIPFFCGTAVGIAFHQDDKRALILGLCMSITALPVVTHLLGKPSETDGLFKRVAIASAAFNDLMAMFAFGILFRLPDRYDFSTAASAISGTAGRMLLLAAALTLAAILGWFLLQMRNLGSPVRLDVGLDRMERALGPGSTFGMALLFVLLFSSFSERLGFHGIVGTFLAALLLHPGHLGERHYRSVEGTLRAVTDGFLGPVFFATLGLHFSGSAFADPPLLLTLLAVALLSKVAAGLAGGALSGMGLSKRFALATLLNGRGMIELMVAEIALKRGFIGEQIFSDLVLLGALTTLCTCWTFPVFWRRTRAGRPWPRVDQPELPLGESMTMEKGR